MVSKRISLRAFPFFLMNIIILHVTLACIAGINHAFLVLFHSVFTLFNSYAYWMNLDMYVVPVGADVGAWCNGENQGFRLLMITIHCAISLWLVYLLHEDLYLWVVNFAKGL